MVKILFHLALALAASILLPVLLRERDMTQLANACEVCFRAQEPVFWEDAPRAHMKQGDYGDCDARH